MIVDTTLSFHEKRIGMAEQLHAAIRRKRAKKQKKQNTRTRRQWSDGTFHILGKVSCVVFPISASWEKEDEKTFVRLMDSIDRLDAYLKKARAKYHNQTVVVL